MKNIESGTATARTTPMVRTWNSDFEYTGFGGCPSWCGLELWEATGHPPVVIVTNPLEEAGTSVTHFAAPLATLICREFALEPRALVWIECYERAGEEWGIRHFSPRTKRSEFDRVYFTVRADGSLSDPEWTPFGLAQAEALVGHPL